MTTPRSRSSSRSICRPSLLKARHLIGLDGHCLASIISRRVDEAGETGDNSLLITSLVRASLDNPRLKQRLLRSTLAIQKSNKRHTHDAQVEPQGSVINVPDVQRVLLGRRYAAAAAHLAP